MATKQAAKKLTISKSTGLPVDPKRSRAAKKAAATRRANLQASVSRSNVRFHHKLIAGASIAVVILWAALGIYDIFNAYAASSGTTTFTGLGGRCMDDKHSGATSKNWVWLYKCNGTNAQKWILSGSAIKASVNASYCLDDPGASHLSGIAVWIYRCNGTKAQQWTVRNNTIVSDVTGYCLGTKNGNASNGTRLVLTPCNGSLAQRWTAHTNGVITGAPVSGIPVTTTTGTTGGSTSTNGNGVTYGTIEHPFSAKSPWNTQIPANPAIDSNSGAIVSNVLNNHNYVVNMILYSYGQPVYVANGSTPYSTLSGSGPHFTLPLDPSWRPNDGGDQKANIFDPKTNMEYELQGFNAGNKSIYWGVEHNYVTGLADGYPDNGEGQGPTGSGMSQVAGMVRISDIASGSIDHALSFITSNPQQGVFRYPASHEDGTRTAPNGIMEGMRIQLDPSFNVDAQNWPQGEKMVAKALQKYGAYCTDDGGSNDMAMGFYAEKPTDGNDPYPKIGWNQDWAQLPDVPRDRLRVLAESVTQRP